MKQALLAASFGSSQKDTLNKTIGAIENTLAECFPEMEIRRAFTSKMIVRKLKREGSFPVDTVEEALEKLLTDSVEEVCVQPTFIIQGEESEKLRALLKPFAERFAVIKVGMPLLSSEEDLKACAAAILSEIDEKAEDAAWVFMGHGRPAENGCPPAFDSDAAYEKLEQLFRERGRDDILIGTVEGRITLNDIIERLRTRNGLKKVICLPLLVTAGVHAVEDLSGDEPDSWKSVLTREGYEVHCRIKGLGEYEGIRRIFAEHAAKAEQL